MASQHLGNPGAEHPRVPLAGASLKASANAPGQDTTPVNDQLPALVMSALPEGIRNQQVLNEQEGLTRLRRDIWVERFVMDIYEYRGLRELGIFVFFFLISSFFLYSQWGTTAASFKNSVVESMVEYDTGSDWEGIRLDGIDTMVDAYQYMTGWVANVVNRTEQLNLSSRDPNVVYVGENAAVRYIRLLAQFDDNCQYRIHKSAFEKRTTANTTACWRNAFNSAPVDYDLYNFTNSFLQPAVSGWQKLERSCPAKDVPSTVCYQADKRDKKTGWFANELLNRATIRSNLLARLNTNNTNTPGNLAAYQAVIGKYAVALQLAVLAEDRFGRDAAVFTLTVHIGGKSKRLVHRVGTWSVNHPNHLSPGLKAQFHIYQAIFFMLTLYYILQEFTKWRLCWLQHRSMSFYFRYWWNGTQIISHVLNMAWILWCWSLPTQQAVLPDDLKAYARLEANAVAYTVYLYFGIIVNLVLGVCMCRYMRVHMGLRAFYQVFVDAGRSLLDFGVFVLYIILVLGSATFAFFQISGGNGYFITFPNGLSAMARLPFQFLDYSSFQNNGVGLGKYAWTVTGLFWLTVIFLILFTQNTLLAIFNLAYINARKKSLKVELSFVSLVVNRIIFMFLYYGIRIYQLGTTFTKARQRSSPDRVDGAERRENFFLRWWRLWRIERYYMHEMILWHNDPTNPIRNHATKLLFCRWCIACLTEMQALAALYTDYATLKLQDTRDEDERPTWISLGGFQRRVVSRSSTFLPASTWHNAQASFSREPMLESETHREQFATFSQHVPAWCSHVNEAALVQLLQFLTRHRHNLHLRSKILSYLLCTPFDALSILEARSGEPEAVDVEAPADASTTERLPNGKVVNIQLVRIIAMSIVAVYVNTSKPIRDADGDGIDDEEDDPAELIRRFRKSYFRDREADNARLIEIQDDLRGLMSAQRNPRP